MKVFISWSGELSRQVANELNKWLPSIIQSVEVFYSPEDIQKGENWDSRLTRELEECKYGIVCLTKENVTAPWVHFEAGALSKSLDSRTSALMIDVVTSDVQGPLSRFQATKLEKNDFYKLVCSINDVSESKISENILENSFDAIWDRMNANIQDIIDEYSQSDGELSKEKRRDVDDVLEELLQLLRKQDAVLNDPEKLFPEDYFSHLYKRANARSESTDKETISTFLYDLVKKIYATVTDGDLSDSYELMLGIIVFVGQYRSLFGINISNRVLTICRGRLEELLEGVNKSL